MVLLLLRLVLLVGLEVGEGGWSEGEGSRWIEAGGDVVFVEEAASRGGDGGDWLGRVEDPGVGFESGEDEWRCEGGFVEMGGSWKVIVFVFFSAVAC